MTNSDAEPDPNHRASRRTVTIQSLLPVSAILGALYVATTLVNLIVLSGRVRTVSAILAGASAAGLLALYVLLRRRPSLENWSNPIAAGIAAVVLANSLVTLGLTADPQHVIGLILLAVGAGLVLQSAPWFSGVLVVAMAGFGTIAWLNPPLSPWLPSAGGLLAASALAVVIHTGRQRTSQQIETLRQTASYQETDLATTRQELATLNAELDTVYSETDSFAHHVGHDLRGPLGNIFSYAILLEKQYGQWPEDLTRRSLRAVATSAQRMINILDQVLILTGLRVDEPEMVPLDMGSITHEALHSMGHMVDEHGPVVIQPETWPTILGHAAWVEEVWRNYLSNAMKYGGAPPRVELGFDPQSDGRFRFWVRDNGDGLSAEEQEQVFGSFSFHDLGRADGNGLGLPIVPELVEKMGGQAGVTSEKNQGSTFWFTLPAADNT